MKFHATELPGVMRILAEPHSDDRGMFARLYCPQEFAKAGINFTPTQVNLSTIRQKHTLRGMHFQKPPFAESKLVRVTRGCIWDVVLDLRPGPTLGHWIGEELSATQMNALFLPEGVAHGFLTLEPNTEVLYQMGRPYEPGHADGVRWDDPAFAIDWPHAPEKTMSQQDTGWPDFETRADLRKGT